MKCTHQIIYLPICQTKNFSNFLMDFSEMYCTVHFNFNCQITRQKVFKVAKGWAKVEKMNNESTLDDSWWLLLMITLGDYSWWVILMSTLDEYSWWVLLMSNLDDCSWWLLMPYLKLPLRTNGRTNERTDIAISRVAFATEKQ